MRAGRIVALVGVIVVAGGVGCESEDDYVSMGGDAGAAGAPAEASGGTASGGRGSQPTGGTPSATGGTPSATGGTPSSMGGSAGEASEPTAGTSGEECDAFDDEESPGDITVRISNGGDAPIFLGPTDPDLCSVGDIPVFQLGPADDDAIKAHQTVCETTCEEDKLGNGACPPACYKTHVVRIEPGGWFDTTWDGLFFNQVDMPAQCYVDPPAGAGRQCLHPTAAEDGLYTVRATAWSGMVCEPGADCECLIDVPGSCMPVSGMNVTGTSREESLEFSYPTADLVEIRFD